MNLIIALAVFGIDIIIHYFTIQSWGWLNTISVNLLLMLLGFLFFKWRESSVDWLNWAKFEKSISKKKRKKLNYLSKHSPEEISNEDKRHMSTSVCISLISFGFLLVILPGLLTGAIGMVVMVVGFIVIHLIATGKINH